MIGSSTTSVAIPILTTNISILTIVSEREGRDSRRLSLPQKMGHKVLCVGMCRVHVKRLISTFPLTTEVFTNFMRRDSVQGIVISDTRSDVWIH
ncbi:hypothetical protein JTE90_021403 [Oedothorax gibbosus]|uniref:Uncharacterized protein n=1 Tax=Oedothorax gibbosus TaxID=931172 RepID=A0AAV6VFZ6_9ARAC|nr:hypothetical protein JTE90_021403 [Oedothorax gibbosus]